MYLESWTKPIKSRPIYDVITVGYPIVSVISIISCLAIVCITIKHEQYRKASAISTIAWCVTTMLFTSFVLPVLTNNIVSWKWGIGEIGCKVWLLLLYFVKTARGLLMAVMITVPYVERYSDRPTVNRAGYLITFIVCLLAVITALGLSLPFAVTALTTTASTESPLTVCISNSSSIRRDVTIVTSVVGSLIPCVYSVSFLIVVTCQHRYVQKYPGAAILVIIVASFTLLCTPGETLFILYKADWYTPTQDDDVFNCLMLAYFSELAVSPLLCLVLPWSSYKTIRSSTTSEPVVDDAVTTAEEKHQIHPPTHFRVEEGAKGTKEKFHPQGHLRHVAMYGKRAFTQHTADLFLGKSYTKSGRAAIYF